MTLVPTNGVLDTILKVAEVDERAANELVRFGLYEALVDQIKQQRPRLEQDAAVLMSKRAHQARTHLLRTTVGKALSGQEEPVDLELAQNLSIIDEWVSKAGLIGNMLSVFNEQHHRGAGGRFVTIDVGDQTDTTDPSIRVKANEDEALEKLKAHRDRGLVNDDTKISVVHHTAGKNGRMGRKPSKSFTQADQLAAHLSNMRLQEPGKAVTGLSYETRGIKLKNPDGSGVLDAAAAFTDGRAVPGTKRFLDAVPGKGQFGTAASDWNAPSEGTDRQGYRQMSMTGNALQAVSVPGSYAHGVGATAKLIGDLGPEAEKVLGPGIRRTAYRYRGTERTPDKDLVQQIKQANGNAEFLHNGIVTDRSTGKPVVDHKLAREDMKTEALRTPVPANTVAASYAAKPESFGWSHDRLELAVRGDTAVIALAGAIPNKKLTEISIAGGELPPSQGIIIDADGDVVSHAQGYNGDHYLPFDLKNLGDLHGGQYVRTRASGGPTTEDVYTGLLAGARQLQVASNSGVYTVEFDPDIRGGRRYSDKAQRMISRYGDLLSAIDSGKLYTQDIPRAKMRELRSLAYEGMWDHPNEAELRLTALEDRERLKGTIAAESDDEIHARATVTIRNEEAKSKSKKLPTDFRVAVQMEEAKIMEAEGLSMVREMKLNGQGYFLALQALKQEFPFYIRDVRYEETPEFIRNRRQPIPQSLRASAYAKDKGRVERGQTNAAATLKNPRQAHKEVPGKAGTTAAVVPADETANATDGTPAARSGGPAPLGRSNAPVHEGPVVTTTLAGTKPLKTLAAVNSEPWHTIQGVLSRSMPMFNKLNDPTLERELLVPYAKTHPDTEEGRKADEAEALKFNGLIYAHYKVNEMNEDPKQIATWLLTQASAPQRKKFTEGFHEAIAGMNQLENPDTNAKIGAALMAGMSPNGMEKDVNLLTQLSKLAAPFAPAPTAGTPAEKLTAMVNATPENGPQPFDSIIALGDKVENYSNYRKAAKTQSPALYAEIDMLEANLTTAPTQVIMLQTDIRQEQSKGDMADAEAIRTNLTKLQNLQRAWSFTAGKEIAQAVDATPFSKALATGHRVVQQRQRQGSRWGSPSTQPVRKQSRLVFHHHSDPWSASALQRLEDRAK